MSNANVALVKELYAAFGRGEVATIIDALIPDVSWEAVGRTTDYPGFGPRKGQDAVKDFFALNNQNLAFTEFSPKEFYAIDDKVFALGRYALTIKKNGRKHESDWIHVFTIRNGKVVQFREFSDTAQAAEAFRD